jgi:two-component system response regulator HydG
MAVRFESATCAESGACSRSTCRGFEATCLDARASLSVARRQASPWPNANAVESVLSVQFHDRVSTGFQCLDRKLCAVHLAARAPLRRPLDLDDNHDGDFRDRSGTGGPNGYVGSPMQSRVLIVDDDPEMREALSVAISGDGHGCAVAASADAALEIIKHQTFDAVVCDVRMDGMSGLELLEHLKRSHPALPFIVISGGGGVQQAVEAIKHGAFEYVVKPSSSSELRRVVAEALDWRRHPIESARTSPPVAIGTPELVGTGPTMRGLQTAIDFVARSSATVLVTGETGAGKELVARAIHTRSARSQRPFVAVNMSAIPADLLEAELFGHVRGAFTGAMQPRKGLFAEADGGTLMLDEIGDMTFALQAKLLRVLQFGEVRPVGSERTQRVDVRVIAVTHRDLRALVKDGRFREDLFFRLDLLRISVPPLRDHSEDIPELARHFLARACQRAPSSPVRSIGDDALALMAGADWPGNVRELASSIERAVVFGVDEMIDSNLLSISPGACEDLPEGIGDTTGWPFPSHAPWTLRRLTRAYTSWVLAHVGGNKERAAEILGIDLSTLYRWQRASRD